MIRDKAAREGVSINSVYKILAVILNMLRFMLVCYQMLQIKKETILCYFAAILHPCIGRQAIGPLYQYFFTIYTGSRPNSGTTAHVLDRDNITWDEKQKSSTYFAGLFQCF